MRKIICDCCGREITGYPIELCWSFRDRITGDIMMPDSGSPSMEKEMAQMKNKEYCEECVGMSIAVLYKYDATKGKTLEELKQKAKRKQLDEGKVIALKEAGWSAKMIAEEFGCSVQAVYNLLVRLKKTGRLEPEEGEA